MFKIVIHDAMSSLRMRLENRHVSPIHMMRGILNETARPDQLVIWAWDGRGGNDARRAIFPGYKDRPPTPDATHVALRFLKELLGHPAAWQAQLDGFEGDDMVAALLERFRGTAPIEIVSRDGDLTALCGPGVTCKAPAPAPPGWIRLYKLTVGDPADRIPGISGFGKGAWASSDLPALEQVIQAYLDGLEVSEDRALSAGLSKRHINWLEHNRPTLLAMKQIIDPLPISPEQLEASLVQGTDNPAAREAILGKFLQ